MDLSSSKGPQKGATIFKNNEPSSRILFKGYIHFGKFQSLRNAFDDKNGRQ